MRRDLREIPARQTTIPAISQCTLSQTPLDRLPASCKRREPAVSHPVSHPCPSRNAGILLMVDGWEAPWFRSMVAGMIRIFPGWGGFRGIEAAMGSSGPGMLLRRMSTASALATLLASLALATVV